MTINELKELLKKFDSSITYNADLKKKNWFNIGGKAKVFFKADELTDLVEFLKVLDNREKIHIIGAGSNTLITDEVYDGVIIKLGKNFNRLSVLNSNIIISGTAVLDKKLSDFAAENSLSGFEFLSCIPGTVGGGLKMNAGCFGTEIKDILVSIQSVDKNGNVLTIPAKEINFEYRNNDLSESLIFLSASVISAFLLFSRTALLETQTFPLFLSILVAITLTGMLRRWSILFRGLMSIWEEGIKQGKPSTVVIKPPLTLPVI